MVRDRERNLSAVQGYQDLDRDRRDRVRLRFGNGTGVLTLEVVSMTVDLPDELAARIARVAAARGMSPETLVVEAVEAHLPEPVNSGGADVSGDATPRRRFAFVGGGDSGPGGGEVGSRHDEILQGHFYDNGQRCFTSK